MLEAKTVSSKNLLTYDNIKSGTTKTLHSCFLELFLLNSTFSPGCNNTTLVSLRYLLKHSCCVWKQSLERINGMRDLSWTLSVASWIDLALTAEMYEAIKWISQNQWSKRPRAVYAKGNHNLTITGIPQRPCAFFRPSKMWEGAIRHKHKTPKGQGSWRRNSNPPVFSQTNAEQL